METTISTRENDKGAMEERMRTFNSKTWREKEKDEGKFKTVISAKEIAKARKKEGSPQWILKIEH